MADDDQYKSIQPFGQLIFENYCLLDTKAEEASARLKELVDPSYRHDHNIVSLKMEHYGRKMPLFEPTQASKEVGLLANGIFRVYVANGRLGVEFVSKYDVQEPKNDEIELMLEYVLIDVTLGYKVTFESTKTLKLPEEQ